MSSIRSGRWVSVEEAKQIIRQKLQPRINEYEARLKQNFAVQFFAYFENFYGEKGYLRTLDFLTDMEDKDTIGDLIELVKSDKYSKGTNMPVLLKEAVLLMCGVAARHIGLVVSEVRHKIVSEYGLYAGLNLLQADALALDDIYQTIIKSSDYGASYLRYLDNQLEAIERAQDRQGQAPESVEMTRYMSKI